MTLVEHPIASSAEQLVVGDIDGDGRPDAAVAAEGSDAVAVLLGRGDLDITASYQYRLDKPESEICLLENRRIP